MNKEKSASREIFSLLIGLIILMPLLGLSLGVAVWFFQLITGF